MSTSLIYVKQNEHLVLVAACSGCQEIERDSASFGDDRRSLDVYAKGTEFAGLHRSCLTPKVRPRLNSSYPERNYQ